MDRELGEHGVDDGVGLGQQTFEEVLWGDGLVVTLGCDLPSSEERLLRFRGEVVRVHRSPGRAIIYDTTMRENLSRFLSDIETQVPRSGARRG